MQLTRRLLLMLLSLIFTNVTYGKVQTLTKYTSIVPANKLENIKFGFDYKAGFAGYSNFGKEHEIFGEYRFYRELGIRVGMIYNEKRCRAESVILSGHKKLSTRVDTKSIDMPITIRFYPIPKWDGYCFFGGIQLGYVIDGKLDITQRTEFMQDIGVWNHKSVYLTLTEASRKVQVQRF